jgi:hypothetical protein
MSEHMINREVYFRDPMTVELLNNGVSKVSERRSPLKSGRIS